MSKEKETNVVDIKGAEVKNETAEPVDENQEETTPDTETVPEVKHTVFGKIDQKIVARREAKAKKKAEKKPMSKGAKVAIIGGGAAIGVGILGAIGKAALNAAARYVDDDSEADDETQDYGYPTEEEPEEPTEVEVDQLPTTETAEET